MKTIDIYIQKNNNCKISFISALKRILKVSLLSNMPRIICLFVMFTVIGYVKCASPLDEYVYHYITNYTWKLIETYPSPASTVYVLNITSQTWLNGIVIQIEIIYQSNYYVF